VIDRVATDWSAAGRGERNCELSVFRILGWMHVTDSTVHLQAATADSCHNVQVLQRHVLLHYCCEEMRQEMYCDFILWSVRSNIGGGCL